ncbi:ricin-type beta-trefoil lectin domain protein [Streptomyces sp. NPDC049627]|uniref:ricin-type beta-trefoil lectin domain protein n=1 Tax=Streptomyces sp. NPDC049627 TaxID=3365595 RepID=UPI0037B15B3D
MALMLSVLAGAASPRAYAAVSTSITVDGTKPGRVFDGAGAISGGGGNTRLLVDYPEAQRSQILDYLFKPGVGASLQRLKLEIGGDTNSTDGAEASHEHTEGAVDCAAGYEWWLAGQAKSRNPNIKLSALTWGAPGWIGVDDPANPNPGKPYFWSQDMIDYLMSWLDCAKKHNLTIDYLGGWNERGWKASWYIDLKKALVSKGYSTKIVAGDSFGWGLADELKANAAFRDAVDVIGVHYPCGYNNGGAIGNNAPFTTCNSTSAAQDIGKPLWASENGSQDTEAGAAPVARALNRDYIDGRMTGYYNWPLMGSLYPNTYFAFNGLVSANQPWSGHYRVGKTAWVMAHTTQFTQIGWRYQDSASGYLGGDRSNGSYVTLRAPDGGNYSTIIETTGATAPQTLDVQVTGGLSTGQVHVWATNLDTNSDSAGENLAHTADVTPSGGRYTVTLQPGHVYTLTTTTGQGKGTAGSPAVSSLSLPQSNDFETRGDTSSPKYFTDMNGAFQTVSCGGGRGGTCLRQMAATGPIRWTEEPYYAPYTVMGDDSWSNYTVSADALLEQPGSVELLGRVGMQGRNNNGLEAYRLRVGDTGAWSILKSDKEAKFSTLKSGTTAALGTNRWHSVTLTMQGSTITAKVDGTVLGTVTDSTYTHGRAGLGTVDSADATTGGGYRTQQFDAFSVTPGTDPTPARVGAVPSGIPGKCLDLPEGDTRNGAPVKIYSCNNTFAQIWTHNPADGTVRIGGKCLDVTEQATANGTKVQIWTCNGGSNQRWVQQADGTLRGTQSGRCLDVLESSTSPVQLVIWTCNGGSNQKWQLPG